MVHWYFDEIMVVERIREAQREADRAQALGLLAKARPGWWRRLRAHLGRTLVVLGGRLQAAEPVYRADLTPSSQCGLR